MEPVVLETLGDVDYFNAGCCLEPSCIDDELVGAATLVVGVENRVVRLNAREDVVGVQEAHLGGLGEAAGTHHVDVGVGDGEKTCATEWSRADRVGGSVLGALGL